MSRIILLTLVQVKTVAVHSKKSQSLRFPDHLALQEEWYSHLYTREDTIICFVTVLFGTQNLMGNFEKT